jgi:hypothetical protein
MQPLALELELELALESLLDTVSINKKNNTLPTKRQFQLKIQKNLDTLKKPN